NSGGSLVFYYYTTSWSSGYTLSSLTCLYPNIFEHHGFIFVAYIVGTDIYFSEIAYLPSRAITDYKIIANETSPSNLVTEWLPTPRGTCLLWRSGTASPYNIRFALLITALENVLETSFPRTNLGDVIECNDLFSNFSYGLKYIRVNTLPKKKIKGYSCNDLCDVWF
ncbi:MAG: hypothetical protein ACPLYF_04055, partial [Fervidobacterium sp.]